MLPLSFQSRLESFINGFPKTSLKAARLQLTHRYRTVSNPPPEATGSQGQGSPMVSGFASPAEAISYLATRLPATFAVVESMLVQAPFSKIGSILDVGAGPGTAALASVLKWPDCKKIHLVEENVFMSCLSQDLLHGLPETSRQLLTFQQGNFLNLKVEGLYDLVILSYVLTELSLKDQQQIILKAWEVALKGIIILVPGTPAGYGQLMAARNTLIESGALIVAPCPHNRPCPIPQGDWCHFSTRLNRSSLHQKIKQATLPYEDEKYSYLIAVKEPVMVPSARLIRKPLQRHGHVTADLCTQEGKIRREIISKRNKGLYKKAAKIMWSDSWEPKNTS